jgi:undecaprenyl-diphosphatase
MALIAAAILGIVQGLTEFLPISSSGHLILLRAAFERGLDWNLLEDAGLNTKFDVALHAGTFLALLVYFSQDIVRLLRAFAASFRGGLAGDPERRLAWLIVIGTIPAAVAGMTGEELIEAHLRERPLIVAALLIVFGLVLWLAEWRGKKRREMSQASWWDGILVGAAQATALAPGVSRSGITITMGLALGMTRETAARFSFLLSIPIVGGTAAYSLLRLVRDPGVLPPGGAAMFAVGTISAALSGYLCIRYFLRYLQTRALTPFIIYRLLVGAGVIVLAAFGLAAG